MHPPWKGASPLYTPLSMPLLHFSVSSSPLYRDHSDENNPGLNAVLSSLYTWGRSTALIQTRLISVPVLHLSFLRHLGNSARNPERGPASQWTQDSKSTVTVSLTTTMVRRYRPMIPLRKNFKHFLRRPVIGLKLRKLLSYWPSTLAYRWCGPA